MNRYKIYWLCQIVGWGMWGFFQIFLYTFAESFEVDQAVGILLQVIYNILTTHLFRWLIIKLKWLDLKLATLIPRILAFSLLLSALNYIVYLGATELFAGGVSKLDMLSVTIAVTILGYWAVYFIWVIFYFTFHYVDRYNKSLKVEAEAMEAELNNLKAQLNPHFIFNALNSIRALVDENPSKSKESITQLSHILRNSLISDRKKVITFSEELKTVMDYLALESIRYEERLSINFDIDRRTGEFLVPPLMLQTLVENGIKHGISNLKNGGTISIVTTVRKKHLTLEIRNTGQLSSERKNGIGLGLENTRKRLELLYHGEATFSIKNENSDTVLTKISIPKI
ncbi:MAG: histidine kinase [Cyclobacteriaceae bacterium]